MINQDGAKQKLVELMERETFSYERWVEKTFAPLKLASTTEKGNLAEDFFASALRECGYTDVSVFPGRRGPYNVRLRSGNKTIDFAVMLATQDVNENFQFNGATLDSEYSHIFCIGILPETIKFLAFPASYLTDNEDYRTVQMNPRSDILKLTRTEDQLMSFDDFCPQILQILQDAPDP